MSFNKQLEAAQGYYELGMLDEAREELNAIAPGRQSETPALYIRLLLALKEEQWEPALEISEKLCAREPGSCMGYIHAAYCLHELGDTQKARELLLNGPKSLKKEPVYYYNLGCYEVSLGKLEEAEELLRRSFEMDEKLLEVARKDPDLESLWHAF